MSIKNVVFQSLLDLKFSPTLDWSQICNTINELPKEHVEMIYALILHHYFVEASMKSNSQSIDSIAASLHTEPKARSKVIQLPFGGKTFENGKGAIYTVEKIPMQLRHVISAYVHIVTAK